MSDLYELLSEAHGVAEKGPRIPRGLEQKVVRVTPDYQRIQKLPRREWQEAPELDQLVDLITQHCRTPAGQQKLRPVQAAALREIHDLRGGFLPIRVGGGKTLISLLSALLLDAQNPLLIVPAALVEKTRIEARKLALHWRIPPIKILSYEKISRADRGWLAEQPHDLVIADECHKLKSTGAGVTKQVRRLLQRKNPPMFVCMSGSITARGIKDYRHLLVWALRDGAPVPRDPFEGLMWSLALDEKIEDDQRADPGPLQELVPGAEGETEIERARDAYRRRLVSTPGVVTTREDVPQVGLQLSVTQLPASPDVRAAMEYMRSTWCTPDDHPFETAIEMYMHANEIASGEFFYRWDPRPPEPWMAARKAWSKFCRSVLSNSRTYDTPMHVVRAIMAGELDDGGLFQAWKDVEHTFKPNSVAVPLGDTDTVLRYAANWLRQNPDTGLVWVQHRYAGERLSQLSGVPYFAREAKNKKGELIELHERSAIVSIQSCSTGRNLQRWNKNLVISPPTMGAVWEQLLGRTHRDGQEADEVSCEILLIVREQYQALYQAIRDADYTQRTTGQPQKLIYATRDAAWPDLESLLLSDQLL